MARSMLNFNFANNTADSARPEEVLPPAPESGMIPPADAQPDAVPLPAAPAPVSEPVYSSVSDPGNPDLNPVSALNPVQAQPAFMNTVPIADTYSSPMSTAGSKRRNSRRASSAENDVSPEEQEERRARDLYASAFPSWDLMPPQVLIRRVIRKK